MKDVVAVVPFPFCYKKRVRKRRRPPAPAEEGPTCVTIRTGWCRCSLLLLLLLQLPVTPAQAYYSSDAAAAPAIVSYSGIRQETGEDPIVTRTAAATARGPRVLRSEDEDDDEDIDDDDEAVDEYIRKLQLDEDEEDEDDGTDDSEADDEQVDDEDEEVTEEESEEDSEEESEDDETEDEREREEDESVSINEDDEGDDAVEEPESESNEEEEEEEEETPTLADDDSDEAEASDQSEQDGEESVPATTQTAAEASTSSSTTPPNRPETTNNASSPRTRPRPPPPPNALYRFLLRQGRIGRVIVMALVLLAEIIAVYLPPLAKFLSLLAATFLPTPSPHEPRRRRDGAGLDSTTSTTSVIGARTGQSKRQQKAQTRQADQVALRQLQRLGNVHEAKYRHVSPEFLQRHRLGPYRQPPASSSLAEVSDDMAAEKEDFVAPTGMPLGKKPKTRSSSSRLDDEDEESEEEDADWVVQALTKVKPPESSKSRRRRRSSLVQPTVSIGVGSKGPSLSVGFEIGGGGRTGDDSDRRRSVVAEALSKDDVWRRNKRRKASAGRPRTSDRDGGDGIFGKIRAVAGTDSLLSRSLLGAYPGDAVPPSEAASPEGVLALAQKYGYGEWSEESEDEEDFLGGFDSASPRRKVKVRRRKKRRYAATAFDDERQQQFTAGSSGARSSGSGAFGLSGLSTSKTPVRRRRRTTADSRTESSDPSLVSSRRTVGRKQYSASVSGNTDAKTFVDELNERRRQSPGKKQQGESPLASSSTLGNRNLASSGSHRATSPSLSPTKTVKMVRPAMSTLNERRQQLQAKKREDDESSP